MGEEYLSEGDDGRPCIKWRRQRTTNTTGSKKETVEEGEETEIGREEKAEAEEYRDPETKLLIREYQKNANPTQATLKLLEIYGGEEWRIDEGVEMSRCIQHLVVEELIKIYKRDSTPDEETRNALEYAVGMNWRKDQGVEGRDASCE